MQKMTPKTFFVVYRRFLAETPSPVLCCNANFMTNSMTRNCVETQGWGVEHSDEL